MKCKMVRTRGGGSSNLDRVRPTALVRRKRGDPSTSIPNEHFEDYIEQEVEVDDEGYPGGPLDERPILVPSDARDHESMQSHFEESHLKHPALVCF